MQVKKNSNPESRVVSISSKLDLDGGEWFVLRGENKFGPFSYAELVKMLQEKSLYEYDYVWSHIMSSWQRVAEISDFNPDSIKSLLKSDDPRVEEIFFRRRHARASYGGSIIVHNNESMWKAKGVEISVGGAALVIENAGLQPGQNLFLHFKPGDEVPPFNATCEIVSKQYVDQAKDSQAPVRYGVRFTNISQVSVQSLKDYTKNHSGKGKDKKAA
jgi:hypothetical protein